MMTELPTEEEECREIEELFRQEVERKEKLRLYHVFNDACKEDVEVWLKINDYDNYEISNMGRVMNSKTHRILKSTVDRYGYKKLNLCLSGVSKSRYIHKLVSCAFIPNTDNKPCVDHIDNDRTNNKLSNLRYATRFENSCNSKINKRNKSGYKGVTFIQRDCVWRAHIRYKHNYYHIGSYDSKEEAVKARKKKANELYGEFVHSSEQL